MCSFRCVYAPFLKASDSTHHSKHCHTCRHSNGGMSTPSVPPHSHTQTNAHTTGPTARVTQRANIQMESFYDNRATAGSENLKEKQRINKGSVMSDLKHLWSLRFKGQRWPLRFLHRAINVISGSLCPPKLRFPPGSVSLGWHQQSMFKVENIQLSLPGTCWDVVMLAVRVA